MFEFVQTTPSSISQPLTRLGKKQRVLVLATESEVKCLHALGLGGGAFALRPQADLQLSLASTELVAWVHDT